MIGLDLILSKGSRGVSFETETPILPLRLNKALRNLEKKMYTIYILPIYMGSKVVRINAYDYNHEASEVLTDERTYETLTTYQ